MKVPAITWTLVFFICVQETVHAMPKRTPRGQPGEEQPEPVPPGLRAMPKGNPRGQPGAQVPPSTIYSFPPESVRKIEESSLADDLKQKILTAGGNLSLTNGEYDQVLAVVDLTPRNMGGVTGPSSYDFRNHLEAIRQSELNEDLKRRILDAGGQLMLTKDEADHVLAALDQTPGSMAIHSFPPDMVTAIQKSSLADDLKQKIVNARGNLSLTNEEHEQVMAALKALSAMEFAPGSMSGVTGPSLHSFPPEMVREIQKSSLAEGLKRRIVAAGGELMLTKAESDQVLAAINPTPRSMVDTLIHDPQAMAKARNTLHKIIRTSALSTDIKRKIQNIENPSALTEIEIDQILDVVKVELNTIPHDEEAPFQSVLQEMLGKGFLKLMLAEVSDAVRTEPTTADFTVELKGKTLEILQLLQSDETRNAAAKFNEFKVLLTLPVAKHLIGILNGVVDERKTADTSQKFHAFLDKIRFPHLEDDQIQHVIAGIQILDFGNLKHNVRGEGMPTGGQHPAHTDENASGGPQTGIGGNIFSNLDSLNIGGNLVEQIGKIDWQQQAGNLFGQSGKLNLDEIARLIGVNFENKELVQPAAMRVFELTTASNTAWTTLLIKLGTFNEGQYDLCKGIKPVLEKMNLSAYGCAQMPMDPAPNARKTINIYLLECPTTGEAANEKYKTEIETKLAEAVVDETTTPTVGTTSGDRVTGPAAASALFTVTIGEVKKLWSTTAGAILTEPWIEHSPVNPMKEQELKKEFQLRTELEAEFLLFKPMVGEPTAGFTVIFDESKAPMNDNKNILQTKVKAGGIRGMYLNSIQGWKASPFPWNPRCPKKGSAHRSVFSWAIYASIVITYFGAFF